MEKIQEDLKLVKRVQDQHCNKSIKMLIDRHGQLFYSVCNKTCPRNHILQEILKDKDFVIYKSAISFKADKKVKKYNKKKNSKI